MANLELNKIAAGVLVAGLIAMVCGTVAKKIYGDDEHAAHEEKRGYKVAVAEGPASGQEAMPEALLDIPALMAAASVDRGKEIVKSKCVSCHSFGKDEPPKIGPNLWGIVGNKIAHSDKFQYSKAFYELKISGWDYDNLFEFLKSPGGYVKGTKMTFGGMRKPEDIASVLAYLRTLSDNPPPLPEKKDK